MASKIRLELDWLKIERPKKRWNLYFVLATEHPDNPDQIAVTVVPKDGLINVRRAAENYIDFVPDGGNAEGMFLLERNMPEDSSLKARLWVMHSRKTQRSIGEILEEISNFLIGENVAGTVIDTLGGTNPWIELGKTAVKGIGGVGKALKEIKDRQLGFVNMDEHFGPEFEEDPEQDRSNKLFTGFGEIGWSWIVV